MEFAATALPGVWVLHSVGDEDERGSFARTFCADEFRAHGIDPHIEQCSRSRNSKPGTLRGLHVQREPHGETKVVRCTRGEIFDVAVDLRVESPTFGRHHSAHLSGENEIAVVMPPGVAHGFVTLAPASEVWYQMSVAYAPEATTGVRWDDPDLAIPWPSDVTPTFTISARDRALPSLQSWSSS
jgi:dTDP-4-dehydrorhamnose 3,5-epimerase